MAEDTKALATKKPATKPGDQIRALLQEPARLEELKRALPALAGGPERFARVALTTIMNSPTLIECSAASIWKALIQSAQLGIEVDNVLGHAYLVPYNTKEGRVAQLIVGYRGLIALARRTGELSTLSAQCVFEHDDFEYEFGTNQRLRHVPAQEKRGKLIAVYAEARLKDGAYMFDVMNVEEVEAIRGRSKAKDCGPWKSDYNEMARKTVTRRLIKYLPLSASIVAQAAALDEYNEIVNDSTTLEATPTKTSTVKPLKQLTEETRPAETSVVEPTPETEPESQRGADEPPPQDMWGDENPAPPRGPATTTPEPQAETKAPPKQNGADRMADDQTRKALKMEALAFVGGDIKEATKFLTDISDGSLTMLNVDKAPMSQVLDTLRKLRDLAANQ